MGWNHQLDSFCSFLFFLCLAYFWESFVANQKGKGIKRQQKKHMTSSLINSQVELVDLRMVLRRLLSQLLGDQILWFKQMIEPPNIWVFPKMVAPPNYQFNRVFHYKPSILGYPYSRKHPYPIRGDSLMFSNMFHLKNWYTVVNVNGENAPKFSGDLVFRGHDKPRLMRVSSHLLSKWYSWYYIRV